MKTKTEHYQVGQEVFVISETESAKEKYWNITKELIREIVIKADEIEYWMEAGWEAPAKDVFTTQEEALEVLKFKVIEQIKNG